MTVPSPLLLLALVSGCDLVGGDPVVDDSGDAIEDLVPEDTDSEDTADTGTDTDTDTADTGTSDTSPVDVVATCAVPDLTALYPGLLPASPWAAWPDAPDCLQAAHDAIIVLGCPSEADGSPSSCQEDRVDKALRFAQGGYGDRFIVTGGAVANEHVEAYALRDLLVAAGVDDAAVEVEPQARHTDENLYYSGLIMVENGWDTAIVISEPEHLWYTATCDANCCVEKGRFSTFQYPAGADRLVVEKAATYVLYPAASPVTEAECDHLESPSKLMCTNLDERQACADDFQL